MRGGAVRKTYNNNNRTARKHMPNASKNEKHRKKQAFKVKKKKLIKTNIYEHDGEKEE